MFWDEEKEPAKEISDSNLMIDALFSMTCRSLPIDHLWKLSRAIQALFPCIADTTGAGIHQIHVAESNNGWSRPELATEVLYPSKRSKLCLRIRADQFQTAEESLINATFKLDEHTLTIGKAKRKTLLPSEVLFCRHLLIDDKQDEIDVLQQTAKELNRRYGVNIKKMMCGKRHTINTDTGTLSTIHLLLGDLDNETSLLLQQFGLGDKQTIGCGLFLPHKSIHAVKTLK